MEPKDCSTNEYEALFLSLAIAYRDCVLGKEPMPLKDETDFERLLELAERHAVVNGVCGAVKCSNCPEGVLKKWTDKAYLAISKEILFDNELSKIKKSFNEAKIRFVPMKGTVIKGFYPQKGLRQFCDYDILIEESKADEAKVVMCSLGYNVDRLSEPEENVHRYISVINCRKDPVFNFELHKKLFGFESHTYFENVWRRIVFDSENEYQGSMSDEDLYLYHVAHFYAHFEERSGAGIRYLADHYVLKQKLLSKISFDREYVNKVLESEKMSDFEKYADECAEELFCCETPSIEKLRPFLTNGVHGTLENNLKLGVEKKGKAAFTLELLFPRLAIMQLNYKILVKHPFLLPFCWIHRFFAIISNKERRDTAKKDFGVIMRQE